MTPSQQNPGHGNLQEISGFKVSQDVRVTKAAEVSAGLSDILNSAASMSWQSSSAVAWRERLGKVFPMLDAAAHAAQPWADASEDYRASLESITARANTAFSSISMAQTMLTAYSHVPYEVTSTPTFQERIQAYEDDIPQGFRSLSELEKERHDADVSCTSGLSNYSPLGEESKWAALQDLYGDAKSVADIRGARMALIIEYTELAAKVAHGDASDEEIAQFTEFMSKTASDPILASEFWLRVGGEEARLLLTGLADTISPRDLEELEKLQVAASAIRESLSVGSACWTVAEASSFAHGLFTDVNQASGLDAVTYLFNDSANSPMGEGLTVTTANILDEWERGPQGFGPGAVLVEKPALTPLGQTVFLENDGLGDWKTTGNDPMARVFATLGLYPDAAFEWLTDGALDPVWLATSDGGPDAPGAGNARIEYWFGERSWESDGMAGVGALWEGSMHASGGFLDGPPNTATWDLQCDLAVKVVNGLERGLESIRPGDMSDAAGRSLGLTLAGIMAFIEPTLWTTGEVDGNLEHGLAIAGREGLFTVPHFDDDALGEVMGHIGNTPDGFAALRSGISHTQDLLLHDAEAGGTFQSWNFGLGRYTKLQAAFDGAVDGVAVLLGRLDDVSLRQQIAVMDVLWSVAPVPDLGALGSLAVGQAGSAVAGGFEGIVVNNERLAIEMAEVSSLTGASIITSQVSRLEHDPTLSLMDVKVETGPGISTKQMWLNGFEDEYLSHHKRGVWNGEH